MYQVLEEIQSSKSTFLFIDLHIFVSLTKF